jgi:hypothetical protein
VHEPHELTVRDVPQLSFAVTLPQFFPRREQNDALLSGVHDVPHTFAVPPPPQVCGAVHEPHELTVRDVPQLSFAVTMPQFFPRRAQNEPSVSGVHETALPNIWISASCSRVVAPLLAVMRRRYCWYAVELANEYVLVWKRAAPAN